MDNNKKPYERLGTLIKNAIAKRKQRDSNFTQSALASECNLNDADISRLLSGERCPGAWCFPKLAEELVLDLTELLLLRSLGESLRIPDSVRDPQVDENTTRIQSVFERAIEHHRFQKKSSSSKRCVGPIMTLKDWNQVLRIGTVLVGDRRESPPLTSADVLALPASTGDLSFLPSLQLEADVRVRVDKILHIASKDSLRTLLSNDILVVGSPTCNLIARVVNECACFSFATDEALREKEHQFESELRPIRFDLEKLEEYTTKHGDKDDPKMRDLRYMLHGFARPGFIDPIDYKEPRGMSPRPYNDFGVVTLCKHPWAEDKVVILAAGRSGPGTAAALKMLSRENAFENHPLGGVFHVKISQPAPWEIKYDNLDPKWDTHPYSAEDYLEEIVKKAVAKKIGQERVDNLIGFVRSLKDMAVYRSGCP